MSKPTITEQVAQTVNDLCISINQKLRETKKLEGEIKQDLTKLDHLTRAVLGNKVDNLSKYNPKQGSWEKSGDEANLWEFYKSQQRSGQELSLRKISEKAYNHPGLFREVRTMEAINLKLKKLHNKNISKKK
jgi:hypothetical protein